MLRAERFNDRLIAVTSKSLNNNLKRRLLILLQVKIYFQAKIKTDEKLSQLNSQKFNYKSVNTV